MENFTLGQNDPQMVSRGLEAFLAVFDIIVAINLSLKPQESKSNQHAQKRELKSAAMISTYMLQYNTEEI